MSYQIFAHRENEASQGRSVGARAPTTLRIGEPNDVYEQEADRVADTVMSGRRMPSWSISNMTIRTVQRQTPGGGPGDQPAPKPNNYDEAAKKLGEAFLKTEVGKKLTDAARQDPLVKGTESFIDTLPGKVMAGAAAVGAVSALAATHTALPAQIPDIPLDSIRPGLSVKITYEGPVDHPTKAAITFSYSPKGEAKKPKQTASERYRAETARMAAEQETFRARMKYQPGSAEDIQQKQEQKAIEDYTLHRFGALPGTGGQPLIPTYPALKGSPDTGLRMPTFESPFKPQPIHVLDQQLQLQPLTSSNAPSEAEKKEEPTPVQRKTESCATPEGGAAAPAIVHEVVNSPGRPLDQVTRDFFEPKFGRDLSGIRVHTDSRAADSARAVNALAYTVGNSVVFGQGKFGPSTQTGAHLIAHELTHAIQQTCGNPSLRLQRQTDAAELDRQYSSAVEKGDWQTAAEKLNGFNREDIDARLAKLSSNQIQLLHEGALANPAVGPDSQVAQLTRPGRPLASSAPPPMDVESNLDMEYSAALRSGDWSLVAEKLNGFNAKDIKTRLAQLTREQVDNLHKGALNNPRLGPRSQVAQLTDRPVGTSSGLSDTDVPMDLRQPLEPGPDYKSDSAYIDNVAHAYYDLLTNRFELQHNDGTGFDLDADRIKRVAKAGQQSPGGPFGGGLFFRNTENKKIYPVFFTASTIPNIVACWNEIEKQIPEALNLTRDALIDVAISAHGVAKAAISSGQKAAETRSASSTRLTPSQAARRAFAKLEPEYAKRLGVGAGGVVHHARELQLLDKYPGAFTEEELNAFGNMRGIPAKYNNTMHLSGFRKFWNEAYEFIDNVVKERQLNPGTPEYNKFVKEVVDRYFRRIDEEFGHLFTDYGKVLK